jgi:hypothetical protein
MQNEKQYQIQIFFNLCSFSFDYVLAIPFRSTGRRYNASPGRNAGTHLTA